MIWSSYFWLGALMTSVTGPSSAPESMTPEEPQLRRANGSGLPQIILDLVGGVWGFPRLRRPHVWRRSEVPTVSTGRREQESEAVCMAQVSASKFGLRHHTTVLALLKPFDVPGRKNNLLSGRVTWHSPVTSRLTSPAGITVPNGHVCGAGLQTPKAE